MYLLQHEGNWHKLFILHKKYTWSQIFIEPILWMLICASVNLNSDGLCACIQALWSWTNVLHFLGLSFLSNPDRIIVLPWHFKYSLSQYTLSKLLYVILKAVFAGLAKVREAPEKKQREKKLPKLVCWRGGEVSAILAVLGQLDRYMKKMISRTLVMLTLSDPAYFWPFKTWRWGA